MLPFARMVKYGNKRPSNNIKKISCTTTNSVLVLTESGDLYGFGFNSGGELGTGATTSVTSVIQIDTGVDDVWGGSLCAMYRKGDEFFGSGNGSYYGSSAVNSTTFVNVTHIFQDIDILNIKKIKMTTGLFILMQNGNLYGCGVNTNCQFGTGETVNFRYPIATLTQTDVVDFDILGNASIILKTDGYMYSAGDNGRGQLGSATATTVLVYTQISKFPNVTNLNLFGCTQSCSLFKDSDGKTWLSGNSYGIDYPVVATTLFSKEAPVPEGTFRFIHTRSGANSPVICTPTGYYVAGTNPYGAYGIGTNVTLTAYTRMDSMDNYISNYNDVPVFDGCFYGTYFAVGERLFGAGNGNLGNVPGYTGTQRNYVEINYKNI